MKDPDTPIVEDKTALGNFDKNVENGFRKHKINVHWLDFAIKKTTDPDFDRNEN